MEIATELSSSSEFLHLYGGPSEEGEMTDDEILFGDKIKKSHSDTGLPITENILNGFMYGQPRIDDNGLPYRHYTRPSPGILEALERFLLKRRLIDPCFEKAGSQDAAFQRLSSIVGQYVQPIPIRARSFPIGVFNLTSRNRGSTLRETWAISTETDIEAEAKVLIFLRFFSRHPNENPISFAQRIDRNDPNAIERHWGLCVTNACSAVVFATVEFGDDPSFSQIQQVQMGSIDRIGINAFFTSSVTNRSQISPCEILENVDILLDLCDNLDGLYLRSDVLGCELRSESSAMKPKRPPLKGRNLFNNKKALEMGSESKLDSILELEAQFLEAARIGDAAVLNRCLSMGVNPNVQRSKDGMTALHLASKNSALEAVQTLLRSDGLDPTVVDAAGRRASQLAFDVADAPLLAEVLINAEINFEAR